MAIHSQELEPNQEQAFTTYLTKRTFEILTAAEQATDPDRIQGIEGFAAESDGLSKSGHLERRYQVTNSGQTCSVHVYNWAEDGPLIDGHIELRQHYISEGGTTAVLRRIAVPSNAPTSTRDIDKIWPNAIDEGEAIKLSIGAKRKIAAGIFDQLQFGIDQERDRKEALAQVEKFAKAGQAATKSFSLAQFVKRALRRQ